MGDIVRLVIDELGSNAVLEPDAMLEGNKGKFTQLVLIGYNQAGEIVVCGSHSAEHSFWILEKAKSELLGMA